MTVIVNAADVTEVYSGRRGCACGCRGNYSTTPRSIGRVVAKINGAADDGYTVNVEDWGVWVDTTTRSYTAYTKRNVHTTLRHSEWFPGNKKKKGN